MKRTILTILVVSVVGCGAHRSNARSATDDARERQIANLERAAQYPWMDDGVCAVRESSGEWRSLMERCYDALDLSRIRFRDLNRRCGVANADAATIGRMVGMCLMVQPELTPGIVIVAGLVVVGTAIVMELQKLKCNCMCMGVDDLGRRHGPYGIQPTRDRFTCEQNCLRAGYAGGGFCK